MNYAIWDSLYFLRTLLESFGVYCEKIQKHENKQITTYGIYIAYNLYK